MSSTRSEFKSLVKLFKACGVKGGNPLSPVATGEILKRQRGVLHPFILFCSTHLRRHPRSEYDSMRRSSSLHLSTAKQNKSSTLKRDIFSFSKAEEDARLAPCYDDNAAKRKRSRFKAVFKLLSAASRFKNAGVVKNPIEGFLSAKHL